MLRLLVNIFGITFLMVALVVLIFTYPVWPVDKQEITSAHVDVVCQVPSVFGAALTGSMPKFLQSVTLKNVDVLPLNICGGNAIPMEVSCILWGNKIKGHSTFYIPPADKTIWQLCAASLRREW